MNNVYDVLIVGSGAAGVQAAWPLVKAGLNVAMIDGGQTPAINDLRWPNSTFRELRKHNLTQRTLFLGSDLNTLTKPAKTHAHQMTSGRKSYLIAETHKLPLRSHTLEVLQTLATGGLTETWGAVCDTFNTHELSAVGLPSLALFRSYYQSVIHQIGISGNKSGYSTLPATKADPLGKLVNKYLGVYYQKSTILKLHRPLLAVLTRKKPHRQPNKYHDLDFWDTDDTSVYRPHLTLQQLLKHPHFVHIPGYLVTHYTTTKQKVTLHATGLLNDTSKQFVGKKCILAAGTLNTCRIVLKSNKMYNIPLTLLTKPHALTIAVNLRQFGKVVPEKRLSFCQGVITIENENIATASAQLYSYSSLLLYKLLPYVPLPVPLALKVLNILISAFVIVDTRCAVDESTHSLVTLKKSTGGEFLDISTNTTTQQEKNIHNSTSQIRRLLWKIGLIPVKTVILPLGSTAHYAGGIQSFSSSSSKQLSSMPDGSLHNDPHIFIADMSTWNYLPAKAPTLTMMANARRIGTIVATMFTNE